MISCPSFHLRQNRRIFQGLHNLFPSLLLILSPSRQSMLLTLVTYSNSSSVRRWLQIYEWTLQSISSLRENLSIQNFSGPYFSLFRLTYILTDRVTQAVTDLDNVLGTLLQKMETILVFHIKLTKHFNKKR